MISAVSPEEENVDDLTVVKFIIKHIKKKKQYTNHLYVFDFDFFPN
jgi:hypothetical protein